MPAPLQDVHVHVRRVGELQEEQLVAGDVPDSGRVRAAGQDVEAVQTQAEGRVIGPANDLPRALVGVDVGAPGERLVGDPHPAPLGGLRQETQLLGDLVVVVDRVRRDRRADQDQVGAELLHHVELALGASQVRHHLLGADVVEVAERLVQVDRQPEVGAARADLDGRSRRGHQVRFEDLDAVEPGASRRGELVLQRSGDAHRGQRRPRRADSTCVAAPLALRGSVGARGHGHGFSQEVWVISASTSPGACGTGSRPVESPATGTGH